MQHIQGGDRNQTLLLPVAVDDYVGRENPVRFIEAFVDQCDLQEAGFRRVQPKDTGRPGYNPADLLKLYIYGYVNRVRSSRRLEAETARNLEVIWLLRGLRPDFKTIADFRKDNRHAFKPVFRQFVLLCRKLDLFGRELLAVDGTRLKAVNSTDRNFTREKLVKMIRSADERLADYLSRLDQTDAEEDGASGRPAKNLTEKIAALKERKTRHEGMLEELERTGQSQVSLTDPDSRAMASHPKVGVGYNAQVAFDAKNKLIVEQHVTNAGSDLGLLAPTAAPKRCSASSGSTLSPTGATTRRTSRRVRTRASRPTSPGRSAAQRYVTVCFARRSSATTRPATPIAAPADSNSIRSTVASRGTTRRCSTAIAMHAGAVSSSRNARPIPYRRVGRWTEEAVLERMEARLAARPEILKQRREIAEHTALRRLATPTMFTTRMKL